MFGRVLCTTNEKPDVVSKQYVMWGRGCFDELFEPFGSFDLLVADSGYIFDDCIDLGERRIVTSESQRKIRFIKIFNILNPESIPDRFGGGYLHKNGSTVTITECETERETIERIFMFNSISVYIISLKSCEERVKIASELAKSLDMPSEIIEGVEGSMLKIEPIEGRTEEYTVRDPEDPEHTYLYSKAEHDVTKCTITTGLRPPQMGCSLSHLKVYRLFLKSDAKNALIFEDDTILKTTASELHRILFYYPYNSVSFCNFSDRVEWFPIIMEKPLNRYYYRGIKRQFNRNCAYMINRDVATICLDYIRRGEGVYHINYVADDLVCHICQITNNINISAPHYKPFTLADIESTDKI